MGDAALTDAEFEASAERGRQFERESLKATAAHFDAASGRLVIDFENGAALLIPARSLQDLEDAGDDVFAGVELHHDHYLR